VYDVVLCRVRPDDDAGGAAGLGCGCTAGCESTDCCR
jgi:hypothetical protein